MVWSQNDAKQISLLVSPEVWLKAKDVAAKNNKPIDEWVCALIDRELEKVEKFGALWADVL